MPVDIEALALPGALTGPNEAGCNGGKEFMTDFTISAVASSIEAAGGRACVRFPLLRAGYKAHTFDYTDR